MVVGKKKYVGKNLTKNLNNNILEKWLSGLKR